MHPSSPTLNRAFFEEWLDRAPRLVSSCDGLNGNSENLIAGYRTVRGFEVHDPWRVFPKRAFEPQEGLVFFAEPGVNYPGPIWRDVPLYGKFLHFADHFQRIVPYPAGAIDVSESFILRYF